eukprot:CAMPEP_0206210052 /NCGR_PEP_ID=MMETSP0166-20121206/17290_1 /ASSEMBLY_ACC=CAM_ASM_000260 /TAXON_ID=95228 /ORGANISM="Vannella robusta, Strain DIVA3 518/3/11/1/6" /LENGTH=62 /DNA_ID=CAMNT_0053631597 /DNA_START=1 /DNA_END=185 /DNA_ORIENTATION=-
MGYTNDYAPGQNEKESKNLPSDPSLWYSDEEAIAKMSKPFIYSYRTNDVFGNKTCLKIGNSR